MTAKHRSFPKLSPIPLVAASLALLGVADVAHAAGVQQMPAAAPTAAHRRAAPTEPPAQRGVSTPSSPTGSSSSGDLPAAPAASTTSPSAGSPSVRAVQPQLVKAILDTVGPRRALVGKTMRFDASGSRDPSGRILVYRWDWEGRGSYASATAGPRNAHVFRSPGTVRVGLLVVDDHGRQARADLKIIVLAGPRGRRRDVSLSNPAGGVSAVAPAAHAAAGTSVTIKDFSFGPAAITIHVGDAVTWLNQGPSSHTATASGIFNTGVLGKGQSASYTFTRPGTFTYSCSIHPFMKASVTVLAASSSGPPGGSAGSNGPAGAGSTGTNAGPGSPGSTPGQPGATTPGSTLPNTGMNVLAEAVAGLLTMMLGMALWLCTARRRHTGTDDSRS